jgi:hypothetical protein
MRVISLTDANLTDGMVTSSLITYFECVGSLNLPTLDSQNSRKM